jgi:hypothetical protein
VFGSQLKKKEKRLLQTDHVDDIPVSQSSQRLSRSKSPENPTISRIQAE